MDKKLVVIVVVFVFLSLTFAWHNGIILFNVVAIVTHFGSILNWCISRVVDGIIGYLFIKYLK